MFITLEGIDGSGKSTASHIIVNELNRAGYLVNLVPEPGGSRLGNYLRKLLVTENSDQMELCAKAELFLYLAARAQSVTETIEPALKAGHVVIGDRWFDTTIAYKTAQGLVEEAMLLGWKDMNFYQMVAWSGNARWPDFTILFRADTTRCLERALRVGNLETHYELKGMQFMEAVAAAYDWLLPKALEYDERHPYLWYDSGIGLPGRPKGLNWPAVECRPPFKVIDANQPLDEVLADVRRIVQGVIIPALEGGRHENDQHNVGRNPADAPAVNGEFPDDAANAGPGGTGGSDNHL